MERKRGNNANYVNYTGSDTRKIFSLNFFPLADCETIIVGHLNKLRYQRFTSSISRCTNIWLEHFLSLFAYASLRFPFEKTHFDRSLLYTLTRLFDTSIIWQSRIVIDTLHRKRARLRRPRIVFGCILIGLVALRPSWRLLCIVTIVRVFSVFV